MCWALRFEFGMGMVPNDAFSMHLELMPNFHGKNPIAFHHIFVAEIPQRFASSALNHTKHYYYQAFAMRIWQQGASFSRQNPVEFHVWCTMVHWQGLTFVYTARIVMLILR